ncbi:GNAT family N-acetyltransferase [Spirosoma spitsbergense]|uniref:GNAT family N-acetyltransferase n=1 Tax=Spirosoma spitsbergense TaxID=431554 RepID=UPI003CCC360A
MGEMVVAIFGDCLTVYHTHVITEAEGKGYARQLLDAMVACVRENKLWAMPLCPCVRAQFKHNPDAYADIWKRYS